MEAPLAHPATPRGAALLVIAAGVAAALHVGKLAPAIPALQAQLGIGLVQAGFLISLVQLAGMLLGLAAGLLADAMGARRTMLLGLLLLSLAGAAGATANSATALLLLRAVEGFGFLLAALPAPGLIRRLVAQQHLPTFLGLWGAYMPFGTAVALLVGPAAVLQMGWAGWWWCTAAVSLVAAAGLWCAVPTDPQAVQPDGQLHRIAGPLRQTLRAPGPWLVALAFAAYSGQWLAVVGFLPAIYAQAGVATASAAAATALAAGVNIAGNVLAGWLLQRGAAPARVLQAGFLAMGIAGIAAFAPLWPLGGSWARHGPYAAVLLFSLLGGLVPGTLFSLAVRLAPGPGAVSTTVGWMQQWSALGQFAGPPLVGWVAARTGGWGWSGTVTAICASAGLLLAWQIARLPAQGPQGS